MDKSIILIIFSLLVNFTFSQDKNYSKTAYGVVVVNNFLSERDCIEITDFMDSLRNEINKEHSKDNEIEYEVTISCNTTKLSKRKKSLWKKNSKFLASKMENKFPPQDIIVMDGGQLNDGGIIHVGLKIKHFEKKEK